MSFIGKTIFVTGASRGIGKAIALRFAKEGANVVVAAKTVEPHAKLAGTIHDSAREIEQAGGKALAIQVDLRDEETVKSAVDKTVEKFGSIDVLVNNASAIYLAPIENMPVKRFDLINSINSRGTYIMCKYAIPHLKKGSNSHIITLSPPIELQPQWFVTNTGYTMSKYGMSLCSYGLSAELKNQVGVNTLWPKTAIWTAAMDMLTSGTAQKNSRKASIVADAALAIAKKDKSVTGNFFIDEELLREEGVTDFDQYHEAPGNVLLPDFFLPKRLLGDFDPKLFTKVIGGDANEKKVESNQEKSNLSSNGDDRVGKIMASISAVVDDDIKNEMNANVQFCLPDAVWSVESKKDGLFKITRGQAGPKPDVELTMDEDTFVKIANGESKATSAFMMGKLKVKGSMGIALKVEKLFVKVKSKL